MRIHRGNILDYFIERKKYTIGIILALAIFLRIVAVFVLRDYRNPETWEYGIIAHNILEGRGYSGSAWFVSGIPDLPKSGPTAFMAPGYTYTLTFFLGLFKKYGYLALELFQAIVSGLISLLVLKIASRIFDERTGILSAFIVAFNPELIYFSKRIGPLIFHVALLALIVLSLLKLMNDTGTWTGKKKLKDMLTGLLWGVTLLFEPVTLPFLLLASLFLVVRDTRKRNFAILKRVVTVWLFCAITISPWLTRNYIVFDQFVFVKSSSGLNFWIGNNPSASGSAWLVTGEHVTTTMEEELVEKLKTVGEVEGNKLLFSHALDYIVDHPVHFLRMTARKAFNFWWPIDKPPFSYRDSGRSEGAFPLIRKISYSLIFFPGIAGLVMALTAKKDITLILLLFLSYTVTYSLFFIMSTRFRIPTDIYMIILVSYLLGRVFNRLQLSSDSGVTPSPV